MIFALVDFLAYLSRVMSLMKSPSASERAAFFKICEQHVTRTLHFAPIPQRYLADIDSRTLASRRVLIFLRCLCTAQRSKRLTEPTRARAARHRDKSSQRDCFARDAACRRKRRCESIADAEIRTAAGDQGSLFLAAAWRVLRSRHLTERQKSAFCSISD